LGLKNAKISLQSPKTEHMPKKSKKKKSAQKDKNKKAFQKMHAKKILSDSKETTKLAILECWSILKEKTRLSSSFLLLS
jgi:hypothetical protein